MCGYFCIGFIDFMFGNKTLIDFTGLFPRYDFKKKKKKEKKDKIFFPYFK